MGTATIHTSTGSTIYYSQRCLLCDNTRRLPEGMTYCTTPWICDECREAVALLKEFITENGGISKDILDKTEKPN